MTPPDTKPPPNAKSLQARPPELMTTREVAEYLRLKERRIYELVRQRAIPCTRVTGKWLFPRTLIDLWLAENAEGAAAPRQPRPPVIAGSHDPLLEWAVRESGCGLALLPGGSLDGISRFARGEAVGAGLHLLDPESGDYNVPAVSAAVAHADAVLVEWARRRQGLVTAAGNPLQLGSLADACESAARFALRQEAAGSRVLLANLLEREGLNEASLNLVQETALSEMDVGLAILEGRADAGLAIEAVARALKLDFVPLAQERYDLLLSRPDYFDPPLQALMQFARSPELSERARRMGGYDLQGLGRIHFNGL